MKQVDMWHDVTSVDDVDAAVNIFYLSLFDSTY